MGGCEKVRHEVATMQFIKAETKILDSPLGLGAFIIMDFIEGEPLGKILETLPEPESGQDVTHDFPRIGSSSRIDHDTCVDSRPLKLKMNETERHGGDNTSSSMTFSSATEYFHHVAEQDLQHLCKQPNSIDDVDDARSKYIHRSIFKAMLPRFVSDKHNNGPFKLICDDFRFGNILVNNATDLKIVAVVDWEWAYAAPYQMLYSPPQEEESKRARDVAPPPASKDERMSSLLQQSMDDGKFWFHELVYSSFESADNPAWAAIRGIIPNLNDLAIVTDTELNAFVEGKMEQLRQYDLK
ncbi:hypothetical protein DL95DRAFT_420989 [Leptodontidium sp. 2 PMI_412]|nr:hypothetical protein DL95DRAFT_420989 [Leptodontidium sp. 2 PMI_412]